MYVQIQSFSYKRENKEKKKNWGKFSTYTFYMLMYSSHNKFLDNFSSILYFLHDTFPQETRGNEIIRTYLRIKNKINDPAAICTHTGIRGKYLLSCHTKVETSFIIFTLELELFFIFHCLERISFVSVVKMLHTYGDDW